MHQSVNHFLAGMFLAPLLCTLTLSLNAQTASIRSADGSIVVSPGEDSRISLDGGQTFRAIQPFAHKDISPSKFAFDPANARRLYAFAAGEGVRISDDLGVSWLDAAHGDTEITAFSATGKGTLLLGTAEGDIFDTQDRQYSTPRHGRISDMLAGESGVTVAYFEYRSEDAGRLYRTPDISNPYWIALDENLPDSPIEALAQREGILFALLGHGVFSTRPELLDWEEQTETWPSLLNLRQIAPAVDEKQPERAAGYPCQPVLRVFESSARPIQVPSSSSRYRVQISFPYGGRNCAWTARVGTGDSGWVSFTPRSGVGPTAPNRPMQISIAGNTSRTHRTATLTVDPELHKFVVADAKVTFVQAGRR